MKYLIFLSFSFCLISCNLQDVVNQPPATYELKQNYPNPFTDSTVVQYGIPIALSGTLGPHVKLVVKDRFDQVYSTLESTANHPAGQFSKVWYGRGLNYQKAPAGVYYIELQINDSEVIKRIVALKQ